MMEAIDWALLLLRLGVGGVFLAHGIKHLGSREKTTNWFNSLGFKSPAFQWFAMTATEIGAGLLLIVGLGTGLAAAAVIGTMLVAFLTVHRQAGFFITAFMKEGIDVEGYEYVLTLGVMAAVIAIAGPGAASLDAVVGMAEAMDSGIGALLIVGGALFGVAQVAAFWRPEAAS